MRVLVTGDRYWTNRSAILRELAALGFGHVLIHGGAPGADSIAAEVAKSLGWEVHCYIAEWHKYGRAAGPVRNQQMLVEGKPERVLAFHPDLSKSKGTADMVRRAQKAGLPVKLVTV